VLFSNASTHVVQGRSFTLNVGPLLQNPGFETGDLSFWTLNGDPQWNYVDNMNLTVIPPHSGSCAGCLARRARRVCSAKPFQPSPANPLPGFLVPELALLSTGAERGPGEMGRDDAV
jgi:hypothetical protein